MLYTYYHARQVVVGSKTKNFIMLLCFHVVSFKKELEASAKLSNLLKG